MGDGLAGADTKRSQIVALARRDPFLRIEEIAGRAETTPRYVRTVLSEERLSLMDLRRHYARTMERRLEGERPPHSIAWPPADWPSGPLSVARGREPEWASRLAADPTEPLLGVSRLRFMANRPILVERLVTAQTVRLVAAVAAGEPLRTLLRTEGPDPDPCEWSFDTVPAEAPWADHLGVAPGAPLARWAAAVGPLEAPVAIEIYLLDAYAVRWMTNGQHPGASLRWVFKPGEAGVAPA